MAKRTIKPAAQPERSRSTSPLERYSAAKAECGNALLLFRMGDFYELFHDDARTAANALGLTLTTRDKEDDSVPMCGFPCHQLDAYLAKLVADGHRTAVIEQATEAPTAVPPPGQSAEAKVDAADLLDATELSPIGAKNATHELLIPVEGHEGLFKCATCGAAESDLDEFTCGEYPATHSPQPEAVKAADAITHDLGNGFRVTASRHFFTPEEQAEAKWQQDLDDAKNDHLEACLQLREAQQLVKAAREREKDALDFYRELHSRGPVVAKPVTPPGEQSGTQQPLPGGSGQDADNAGASENGWRSIPLADLPLDSIQGLGEKKRESLLEMCPTLGAFTDKQVEAGASGVNTVLPKGIGKAITDPLEEMVLNAICEWRKNAEAGTATESADSATAGVAEMADVSTSARAETHSAIPSFTEWELMTVELQHDWINARAAQISESLAAPDILTANLTADSQAGGLAHQRGESVTDCPRVPGDEMDQWLAGYFDAAREGQNAIENAELGSGELQSAGIAESGPSLSLFDDLDGI